LPERLSARSVDRPDVSYGLFAQQQWRLSPAWNAYIGVRFDDSKNHAHFVSPRVALIYQASPKSTYKFLLGRAFRNANAYEMFYADGVSQISNARLRPEQADTFEVAVEHRFNDRLSGLVTAYRHQMRDLIVGVVDDSGMLQYQNVARSQTNGVEMEATG